MNIKASLRYQLSDHLKGCLGMGLLFISIIIITIAFNAFKFDAVNINMNGFSIVVGIYLFVVGIVAPRSYLRLDAQMGVSRKTSFVAILLTVTIVSLLMALAGELLSTVAGLLVKGEDFFFADLYQFIYNDGEALDFGGHVSSGLFNACIFLYCNIAGMFFTLLFWRLQKFWTIFAAIALVLFVNFFLNCDSVLGGFRWFQVATSSFINAVTRGPGALMIFFIVSAAILAGIEWLLLRRAYIKASV